MLALLFFGCVVAGLAVHFVIVRPLFFMAHG